MRMFMARAVMPQAPQRVEIGFVKRNANGRLHSPAQVNSVRRNMNLTERQQEVLDYISHMQATAGVMPSTREIQEHFGFASQTAAVNHLRALEKKGMIHRQPGKARAVAVVSQLRRERIVDVPIY